LEQNFIKVILTKNQGKSKRDKKGVKIRKSEYVELDGTHCCIGKFNIVLNLYRVLEITLYFSKGFLKTAVRRSAATEALKPLEVTMVCFLEQESNLWFPVP